jgi:nitrogen-specific signal transduction histidine kinase
LRFLTRFGTRIAFKDGVTEMNITEMNVTEANASPVMAALGSISLDSSEVQAMRHRIHELANVFTGVMIAGDLLSHYLEAESLRPYVSHIREGSARGCVLVREIRSQLLAACGEVEAATNGNSADATHGQQGVPESIS